MKCLGRVAPPRPSEWLVGAEARSGSPRTSGGPGEGRAGGGRDRRSLGGLPGPGCPLRAIGGPGDRECLVLGRARPGRPSERPAGAGVCPGPPEDQLSRGRLAGLGPPPQQRRAPWSWGPIGSLAVEREARYMASPQALRRVDENHETPENIPNRHDDTRGSPSRAVKVDMMTSIERDGPWKCG
ncbi:hypothetical protein NDU88_006429 [Pleurodeles waltl]|uniref:Uncharacterized protein n=1 Tax=Pleurodeles waltl TaxID=8319 RepID=A0AAV7VPK6_PLEWA|nr:hypothetical protein NDU88_006429 [Pleurodeles waltl]